MKLKSIKTVSEGAVSGQKDVVIEVSKEQADELRQALKTVDKYRLFALKETKEEASDWTMTDFAVKNNLVIVSVRQGACG